MNSTERKPRILFVLNSYILGGISQSLTSLLSFVGEDIQADVFAFNSAGIANFQFPNCRMRRPVLFLSRSSAEMGCIVKLLQKFLLFLSDFSKRILNFDLTPLYLRIGGKIVGSKKYDAVVCYSEGVARYVCHIPSIRRIAWIHCDYQRFLELRGENEIAIYAKFDTIVCVSKFGKKQFDLIYPQYSNKSISIHNLIDVQSIIEKTKCQIEDNQMSESCFKIISIGRFDAVKQFDKIPAIAQEIKRLAHKPFVWYVIGDGDEMIRIRIISMIEKLGLQNAIKVIGARKNVFPYILKSNLLVNTSGSEAYSLVNNEAKALGIPVVTNDFECAYETIIDGIDGRVVPLENMPSVIASIINGELSYTCSVVSNTEALNDIRNLFKLF